MKTLYLVLSPKKKWSNSAYLAGVSRPFSGRGGTVIHYRGPKDIPRITEELGQAGALVLVMPLFVDGNPSHALELMEHIQAWAVPAKPSLKVYSIINCGFYEGQQCEYALEMVECWCLRCGFSFMGGRGAGAGEMFGILRLNVAVGTFLLLADALACLTRLTLRGGLSLSAFLDGIHPWAGLITIALGVLWSLGPWYAAAEVGRCAKQGRPCGIGYTTVTCCPAFLFAGFASLYWILRALLIHRLPLWKMFRRIR